MVLVSAIGHGFGDVGCRPLKGSRRGVRYADPLSWAVLAAAESALEDCELNRSRIALLTAGLCLPIDAMKRVSEGATRGLVSPTIFPAANPSSPAGLTCFLCSLRGPSLHLANPWRQAEPVARLLVASWLQTGLAVLVARCENDYVRAVLLELDPSASSNETELDQVLRQCLAAEPDLPPSDVADREPKTSPTPERLP